MFRPGDSPISSVDLNFGHNRLQSLEFVTEHSDFLLVSNLPRSEHDERADGLTLGAGDV